VNTESETASTTTDYNEAFFSKTDNVFETLFSNTDNRIDKLPYLPKD